MSTGQVEKVTKKSQLITTKSHHINNGLKLLTFADDCMKEGLAYNYVKLVLMLILAVFPSVYIKETFL